MPITILNTPASSNSTAIGNIVASIGFGKPMDPVFNAVHDIAVGQAIDHTTDDGAALWRTECLHLGVA